MSVQFKIFSNAIIEHVIKRSRFSSTISPFKEWMMNRRVNDERRILTKNPTKYNDFQWSGRCTDF